MEIHSTGNTPVVAASAAKPGIATEAPAAANPAPVETTLAVRQTAPAPEAAELAQAVKNLNKAMREQDQSLEFSIDADTNHTVVKVVDQSTKEVLRQIPSQEALEIAKALDRSIGLLIRQKA
ncbi:flagellar protein FlaG [Paucimonas lemoignei]|uniref:Flagellar protein FlaG n=1 Tax=Paucimonas lemoignei TaxID=29443 RepID=A0A4R3I1W2_PAULE|nr:flagellar protein FlaG [Paucimonas lemoignei]TCS39194.1 flagellar protein FlaG [Paucimonas lemoignei]